MSFLSLKSGVANLHWTFEYAVKSSDWADSNNDPWSFHVHMCTTSSDFRLFSSVELSSIFISFFRFFGHQDQINLFKVHAYFMWAVYDIYVIIYGDLCWIWKCNGKRNSEEYLLLKLHYCLCMFMDQSKDEIHWIRIEKCNSLTKMPHNTFNSSFLYFLRFNLLIFYTFQAFSNQISLKLKAVAKTKYDRTANASGFHLFCYVILSSSSSKCSTVANKCAIRRIKPKMCYFSFKW